MGCLQEYNADPNATRLEHSAILTVSKIPIIILCCASCTAVLRINIIILMEPLSIQDQTFAKFSSLKASGALKSKGLYPAVGDLSFFALFLLKNGIASGNPSPPVGCLSSVLPLGYDVEHRVLFGCSDALANKKS